MKRGYVLPSRRASAPGQVETLKAAGVTVWYIEGENGENFDEVFRSLRRGDQLSVSSLWNLAPNRRLLRERVSKVHELGATIFEASTGRDSAQQVADMIFDAADALGQLGKGRDPDVARRNGGKGGRPRKDRKITDAEAERHWFDLRHKTNEEALQHMGGWKLTAAWRKWGKSGRPSGPRRSKLKTKQ